MTFHSNGLHRYTTKHEQIKLYVLFPKQIKNIYVFC